MTKIIDGKLIASLITKDLSAQLKKLSTKPTLAIVTINPDARSLKYVALKQKKADEIGINIEKLDWSGLDSDDCVKKMRRLADSPDADGIIVQLPAIGMDQESVQKILDEIPPSKDVDGLSTASLHAAMNGEKGLIPATPKAILEVLKHEKVVLKNKLILIVGQGKLVGKPLSVLLLKEGLEVKVADSATENLSNLVGSADIVISAVGKPKIINSKMIKNGAVVIDAGISEIGASMIGDIDYEGMDGIASKIAKVPGGVGPVTVVSLLQNVIEAAKNSQ